MRAGIIGISEGNGHPYSWSAICNGYNEQEMLTCPFPVIPEYLGKEKWPEARLKGLEVTHIWTQSYHMSRSIAKSSNILNISNKIEDLIKEVDVVLLARDDAENHYKFALPAIEAGKPIFIDKPFALSVREAERLWSAELYDDQIFSCSALHFAAELQPEAIDIDRLGQPKVIWATIPKNWDKYAVHLIEPILKIFPERGSLVSVKPYSGTMKGPQVVEVEWSNDLKAYLFITKSLPAPIWFRVLGDKGYQDLYFEKTFNTFKSALENFISVVKKSKPNISKNFTMEVVEILEKGRSYA